MEPEETYMPTAMEAPCVGSWWCGKRGVSARGEDERRGLSGGATIDERYVLDGFLVPPVWRFRPREACWLPGTTEGWGTLGMGADRARSAPDFGSDAVDARVGDPRPRRDAFGDARRRGRPPRDAPAPRGPGVLQVDFACETGERLESSSRGLGGETHRRVLRGDLGSVAERGDVGHRRGGGRGGGIGDGQTGHRLVHRGIAGPAEPPKMALIMDGLGTAAVRAGRAIRAPAEVLTPRVAARRALERTISNPERGATLRRYGRTRGLICAGVGHPHPLGLEAKIFSVGDGFSSRFLAATHCTWEDQSQDPHPVSIDSGKHGLFSADQVFLGAGHNLLTSRLSTPERAAPRAGRNPRETPPAEQPE